jgi:hypothetical protein
MKKNVAVALFFFFSFWFIASHVAVSAEDEVRQVTAFQPDMKTVLERNHWELCGDYFASTETQRGRVVHFNFEDTWSIGVSPESVSPRVEQVVVAMIDDRIAVPLVVVVWNDSHPLYVLGMNMTEFKKVIHCINNGIKI